MMLAQSTDLPAVPAETLKWVLIILGALLFIALAIFTAWNSRKESIRIEDPLPEVRKSPKRYNHDATEQRFGDLERRVGELEEWRDGLIEKLESDKQQILEAGEHRAEKLHERINIILAALSELKGTVGAIQRS